MPERPERPEPFLLGVAGSTLYGLDIPGTSDRDEMGVFLERPDQIIGLSPRTESIQYSTAAQGTRSHAGDVDVNLYSLHKFISLCMSGNPTTIMLLFTRGEHLLKCGDLGDQLFDITQSIVSKKTGPRFIGYLDAQVKRLHGEGKVSRMPKRPELVEKYGFDVKYVSHALRLAYQGVELFETGKLELPMPEETRKITFEAKTGHYSFDESMTLISEARSKLLEYVDNGKSTPLPDEPDMDVINDFLYDVYTDYNLYDI